MLAILGSIFTLVLEHVHGTTCNQAYMCAGTVVTSSTADIDCDGYHSCSEASVLQNGSYDIGCDGSYSCYEATNVVCDSGNGVIYCNGLYSCAFVDNLKALEGSIDCFGELSCFGSKMRSDSLYCYGDSSCANSIAYIDDEAWFYGYLSAKNSILYSEDEITTFRFVGINSGNNATIICGNGHTCNIYCYGNACNHLTLTCDGSCSFIKYCSNAEKSNVCDDDTDYGYQVPSNVYDFPNLQDVTFSTYDNSFTACDTDGSNLNGIHCDDFEECESSALSTTSGSICCTARNACYDATSIDATPTIAIASNNNVAVRCDGFFSCYSMTGDIVASDGGNMYFGGYNAADLGSGYILATNDYDIFCGGSRACRSMEFQNASNLYCGGSYSCAYSQSIQYIGNVYALGYAAAVSSDMYDIRGSVYCTNFACAYSIIDNVAGDVYAVSSVSLYTSTITNVGGDVIVLGSQGLFGSTVTNVAGHLTVVGRRGLYNSVITNVNEIFCEGESCCEDANLRDVSKITAIGDNALSGATIISDDRSVLTINIDGTNDNDNTYVYCNATTTCLIDCQSENACTNLYLYCFGECYVNCDPSNGIECPFTGVYTIGLPSSNTPSNTPSNYPTVSPTWVTPCVNDPCDCDPLSDDFEDAYCNICSSDGCSQCQSVGTYFKLASNYPCVLCQDVFGDECKFCGDYIGCKQCINGFTLTYDSVENVNYCQANPTESPITPSPTVTNNCDDGIELCENSKCYNEDPDIDENPDCSDHESWGCKSCNNGYFMKSHDYPCVECSFIDGCIECSDWSGCTLCSAGYTRYWDEECNIGRCLLD